MARLHNQADGWTPPVDLVRIRWDHETLFGDVMVYGDTPARACRALLPAEVRARFEEVKARMAEIMAGVGDVGLIHADLHLGNALFHRGGLRLIDFDDCGTGARLYELAVALWELRDRGDYAAFREALLAGYRAAVHRRQPSRRLHCAAAGRGSAGPAATNDKFDGIPYWSLAALALRRLACRLKYGFSPNLSSA